ncbi:uncharacterized protein F54H12.2-like [Frankliniella occidentalis]|uniref:Uncharacterized protein F54H12.2-like n=1 Tax=Frankliniella occidentalis TaxID=133901 RepID=A0A6J1T8A6_FRAOC|nr:uncharacterized protein F54H12.2-like [Frankliniella occidentalis]
MSFLHHSSAVAVQSALDLWMSKNTNVSVIDTKKEPCKAVVGVTQTSTQVQFRIHGTSAYIDTNGIELDCTFRITSSDGKALAANESDVAPVNYIMHSMWEQASLSIGNTPITQSSMTYPYRAYLEAVLSYDRPAKVSHMGMRLYSKDTAGHMDSFTGDDNAGLAERRRRTANSKIVKVRGPLHLDFLNQEKYLLPNTDLEIKLSRGKDSFALMSTAQSEKIEILDATLWVPRVTVSPSICLAHAKALEHSPARYPFTRTSIKTVTIPGGLRDKSIPNVFMGPVPNRVTVMFVSNVAYNGSYRHNPFNCHHFDLYNLSLFVDTDQYPAIPLTPDFANEQWTDAYSTLFSETGIHFKDEGNDISYDDYGKGYTIFCFDLTPDKSAHEGHWNLQRQGVVRLEMRFKVQLPAAVNCIIYSEFDNILEIDKNRQVIVDYSV